MLDTEVYKPGHNGAVEGHNAPRTLECSRSLPCFNWSLLILSQDLLDRRDQALCRHSTALGLELLKTDALAVQAVIQVFKKFLEDVYDEKAPYRLQVFCTKINLV